VNIDIRLLQWHDLPFLYQSRSHLLSLDSALLLTHGNPVGMGAFLVHLHPSNGTVTAVCNDSSSKIKLIGQMNYTRGDRSARLSYLLPYDDCSSSSLIGLLEGLASQAGGMGAFSLLAELDETSPAFENMRRAGFTVFGWQRIWKLPFKSDSYGDTNSSAWRDARSEDEIGIRSLFQSLVPPLAQGFDPLPLHRSHGMVYCHDGEVMAYVESTAGPRGIYLRPLIHPDMDNVGELLHNLAPRLAPLLMRPVYLSVRSYQAYLEPSLEQINAEVAPRQALLAKRLAVAQRVMATNPMQAVMEARHAESTAPLVNHIATKKPELNSLNLPGEHEVINN
jgi:hypothetical protein